MAQTSVNWLSSPSIVGIKARAVRQSSVGHRVGKTAGAAIVTAFASITLGWDSANAPGWTGLVFCRSYGRFGKTGAPSAGLVSVGINVQLIIV